MSATAPSEYKTAGIFMLISGITSAMCSLLWIGILIWICIGVIWIPTLVVAIIEIVVGASVMSGTHRINAKTTSILGLVSAFVCGNVVGLVLEILAIVYLGKPEVEAYLAGQA